MQHILYLTSAKSLSVEMSCFEITYQTNEQQQIHPQDVSAIIVENTYCQLTIPALLLCSDYQIPVLLCDQKHQPRIYCLDYYQHTELKQKLHEQINWTNARKKAAWISIIYHKLQHQINLLQQYSNTQKTIDKIQKHQQSLMQGLLVKYC